MHPFPPHHSTPPPPYSCITGLQRFHIIIARYCHIARWLQHESSTTGSACITTNYLTTGRLPAGPQALDSGLLLPLRPTLHNSNCALASQLALVTYQLSTNPTTHTPPYSAPSKYIYMIIT